MPATLTILAILAILTTLTILTILTMPAVLAVPLPLLPCFAAGDPSSVPHEPCDRYIGTGRDLPVQRVTVVQTFRKYSYSHLAPAVDAGVLILIARHFEAVYVQSSRRIPSHPP